MVQIWPIRRRFAVQENVTVYTGKEVETNSGNKNINVKQFYFVSSMGYKPVGELDCVSIYKSTVFLLMFPRSIESPLTFIK